MPRYINAGFSMENVRFMKPGDSHMQNGLLMLMKRCGEVMPAARVRLCNLVMFFKTRRPKVGFRRYL